jgi:hypothetical protein
MTRLIFTISFSLLVFFSYGQATFFTTKDSLNNYCDKMMQTLQDGKFSTAIQMLQKNSVIDSAAINNIDKTLNEQMVDILAVYKKIIAYQLIEDKEALKNTLTRRRYLMKFENYFLIFDFVLYNNGSGWKVSNLNYKDDPKELF